MLTRPKMATESFSKPSLPWRTRLSVSIVSAVTDKARRSDGSINRRLLRFLEFHSPPNPKPVNSVSSYDVPVDPSRNLWFRLFSPVAEAGERLPVVVFFHGGGFAFLSPSFKFYDDVCRRFAKEIRAHVVSVNYRLSPEHRFPSQYDDGFDVLKFLEDNRAEALPSTVDLSRCFLAGDSAGGNIAHHVAVRFCRARSGFETLRLAGLISIQPFFGGEERTESDIRLADGPIVSLTRTDWLWKVFLPDGSNRDHEAVNVSGPNAVELSGMGFPETIVFVAGFDTLQDWQRRYYHWLKKSGIRTSLVEYPNMIHAFYIFPELPESGQLITQIKQFIRSK